MEIYSLIAREAQAASTSTATSAALTSPWLSIVAQELPKI
jgi:hypothetical protein